MPMFQPHNMAHDCLFCGVLLPSQLKLLPTSRDPCHRGTQRFSDANVAEKCVCRAWRDWFGNPTVMHVFDHYGQFWLNVHGGNASTKSLGVSWASAVWSHCISLTWTLQMLVKSASERWVPICIISLCCANQIRGFALIISSLKYCMPCAYTYTNFSPYMLAPAQGMQNNDLT